MIYDFLFSVVNAAKPARAVNSARMPQVKRAGQTCKGNAENYQQQKSSNKANTLLTYERDVLK